MSKVLLTKWKPGLKKVSLTKLLQAQANLSLRAAKAYVDCFLEGEKVAIEVSSLAAAKKLATEASKLGATGATDTPRSKIGDFAKFTSRSEERDERLN